MYIKTKKCPVCKKKLLEKIALKNHIRQKAITEFFRGVKNKHYRYLRNNLKVKKIVELKI
jgi:excinuclease UvrABC ATPase subunit